ncbi:hypothetical protein SAMD00019534_009490 [Acytostelium subglobosum LB1]|uniref:hypothetical protein n=1 Tax=Acytostelium subglobosum LB1 TaxID=1410327 RepID=UPI0006451779|nr:hypothetical protein SAMD00019534_009490 [Acytostelium subglobosum LB1]GAM17774.1 hypothetical protein SAMD00019534_009490 [Acytostelium subglobosum LB1]|eukprot:XP_012758370.1 hypothetical protein SAMD00019534_009490 [Acytostelium subglobosum LB1]
MSISWEAYNAAIGKPADYRGPTQQPAQPQVVQPQQQPQQNISWEAYNQAIGQPSNYRGPTQQPQPQPQQQPQQPQPGQNISWEAYNQAIGQPANYRGPTQPQQQPMPQPGSNNISWEAYNAANGFPSNYRGPNQPPAQQQQPMPQPGSNNISWEAYNRANGFPANYRGPNQPPAPSMPQPGSNNISWEAYNAANGFPANYRGPNQPPAPSMPQPGSNNISWEAYNAANGFPANYRGPNQPPAQPQPQPQPQQPKGPLPAPNAPSISWEDYNRANGFAPNYRGPMPNPNAPAISWEAYNKANGFAPNYRGPGVTPANSVVPQPNAPPFIWDEYNRANGLPMTNRVGANIYKAANPTNPTNPPLVIPGQPVPNPNPTYPTNLNFEEIYRTKLEKEKAAMNADPSLKDPAQWIEKTLAFIPGVGAGISFASWIFTGFIGLFANGQQLSVEDYVKSQIQNYHTQSLNDQIGRFILFNTQLNKMRAIYDVQPTEANLQQLRDNITNLIREGIALLSLLVQYKHNFRVVAFILFATIVETINFNDQWKFSALVVGSWRQEMHQWADQLIKPQNPGYDDDAIGPTDQFIINALMYYRSDYFMFGRRILEQAPRNTMTTQFLTRQKGVTTLTARNCMYILSPGLFGAPQQSWPSPLTVPMGNIPSHNSGVEMASSDSGIDKARYLVQPFEDKTPGKTLTKLFVNLSGALSGAQMTVRFLSMRHPRNPEGTIALKNANTGQVLVNSGLSPVEPVRSLPAVVIPAGMTRLEIDFVLGVGIDSTFWIWDVEILVGA